MILAHNRTTDVTHWHKHVFAQTNKCQQLNCSVNRLCDLLISQQWDNIKRCLKNWETTYILEIIVLLAGITLTRTSQQHTHSCDIVLTHTCVTSSWRIYIWTGLDDCVNTECVHSVLWQFTLQTISSILKRQTDIAPREDITHDLKSRKDWLCASSLSPPQEDLIKLQLSTHMCAFKCNDWIEHSADFCPDHIKRNWTQERIDSVSIHFPPHQGGFMWEMMQLQSEVQLWEIAIFTSDKKKWNHRTPTESWISIVIW